MVGLRTGLFDPFIEIDLPWADRRDGKVRVSWAIGEKRMRDMEAWVGDEKVVLMQHLMLGMNAHAMGIRHDLILGEGNSFIRDVKAGIDDYLSATSDPRQVPIASASYCTEHIFFKEC